MASSEIPLNTLLEWYKIRDLLFGRNEVLQNFSLSLELVSSCSHPDACWLSNACVGKEAKKIEDALKVFLPMNDARALCFAWLFDFFNRPDLTRLRRSAGMGFAFAEALLAGKTSGDEKLNFALLSAGHGERDGFHELGWCYLDGEGCRKDVEMAKENFLLASKNGHLGSMVQLGILLDEADPLRWHWWGQAAIRGYGWRFLREFTGQVELFNSGCGSAAIMFTIGKALQGHVNEEAKTIFGKVGQDARAILPAKQAIAFYEAQIQATKHAMHAWIQVGIRWKVVKDVRKLIAKLIWDSREEALFHVEVKRVPEALYEVQPSGRVLRSQKRPKK
jgi:hypothetical protein